MRWLFSEFQPKTLSSLNFVGLLRIRYTVYTNYIYSIRCTIRLFSSFQLPDFTHICFKCWIFDLAIMLICKKNKANHWHTLLEVISWIFVIAFLFIISGFRLLTVSERLGLSSSFFLLATLISFLVVFTRNTELQSRLEKLPKLFVTLFSIGLLTLSIISAGYYLFQPSTFIWKL